MRSITSFLILCFLLLGCSEQKTARPAGSNVSSGENRPALPDYAVESSANANVSETSKPDLIRGNAEIGRKVSAIILCPGEHGGCSQWEPVPGMIGPCWLEFSESGRASITDLSLLDRRGSVRTYWLEGEGRVITGPGHYGRESRYSCLVQVTAVQALMPQSDEMPEMNEIEPVDK